MLSQGAPHVVTFVPAICSLSPSCLARACNGLSGFSIGRSAFSLVLGRRPRLVSSVPPGFPPSFLSGRVDFFLWTVFLRGRLVFSSPFYRPLSLFRFYESVLRVCVVVYLLKLSVSCFGTMLRPRHFWVSNSSSPFFSSESLLAGFGEGRLSLLFSCFFFCWSSSVVRLLPNRRVPGTAFFVSPLNRCLFSDAGPFFFSSPF